MLETYGLYVIIAGVVVGLLGYVWLLVRAFRQSVPWGFALLFFPPCAPLFVCLYFRRALAPLIVLFLACIVTAAPFGVAYYERNFLPRRPYEQVVDGEVRVTLTGLKNFDYTSLHNGPEIVVLQMANDDVDDGTLECLKGMTRLRKLDLRDTHISDDGLAIIAALPKLQELYLARTKITDEGFRKHLMPCQELLKIDLTGTQVKGSTKRAWKKARADQRDYVD